MDAKPWLNFYDEDVPASLAPYPRHTLFDLVKETAHKQPDHLAIEFKGKCISYSNLDHFADAFAVALQANGIVPGDRVALLLPNCPQFIICQIGAWRIGAIVSPVNPAYMEKEIEHALKLTNAKIAVVLTSCYDLVKRIQPRTGVQIIIATNIKEFLSSTNRFLFTLFRERQEGHRIHLSPEDLWLSQLLSEYNHMSMSEILVKPEDPALLMFTGGTTGKPKAALSSHEGLLISAMQIHAWMTPIREDWRDVTLLLMPMFHTYGNIGAFGAALINRGSMVVVPDPRDLNDVVDTIDRLHPNYISGVPTLFTALLNHPAVKNSKVDFSSVKLCICGAAPLMSETKRRFEEVTGGRLLEGYALTESVMAAVITPISGKYKPGAVGIPLPDVEIKVVDPDHPTEGLEIGSVGEILIRAPQLMLEYWRDPISTAATIREGWLFTGDLGYIDEEGYLYLIDRAKDVIKPSGFQVWPREVEEVISSHPAVEEVGVVGVPDPVRGEAVKAWIVLRPGKSVQPSELKNFCRQRLTAYKVPRKFEFCDRLPKSSVGKVLRRELRSRDN